MLKNTVWLFIIFCCLSPINSQKIEVGVEGGLATFSMDGLKKINFSIISQLPFKVKTVDNFPPTIYYRPFVSIQIDKLKVGYIHTYTSTGSRLSIKDYSGEYRFDMIASTHSPSLHADIKLTENPTVEYYFRLIGGLNLTELKTKEYFMFDSKIETDEDYRFKSTNLFFEPSFRVGTFYKKLNFSLNIGYHSVFGNKALQHEEDSQRKLETPDQGAAIKPKWDGIRVGLGVSYIIN